MPKAPRVSKTSPAKKRKLTTVAANRFVLKDGAERTRGLFECSPAGIPSLRLLDSKGKTRALVSLDGDKPRVRLLDAGGAVRLSMMLRNDAPGLEFADAGGTRRMVFYLRPQEKETADLVYLNSKGKPTLGITTTHKDAILLQGHDDLGHLVEPIWFARDLQEEDSPFMSDT